MLADFARLVPYTNFVTSSHHVECSDKSAAYEHVYDLNAELHISYTI